MANIVADINEPVDTAATYKKIHPNSYLSKFISENIRPDGRSFDKFRPVNINFNSITSSNGSALVRMGEMTVLCTVRAEVAEPDVMAPNSGFLVSNIDLPPLCSSKFKQGPPSEEAMMVSSRVRSILLSSNIVPLHSLVIEPEKTVWSLGIDVTCINYDGNAVDASLIAIVSALRSTRLPTPSYNPDTGITTGDMSKLQPLQVSPSPALSFTFILFESTILTDPTGFEESLAKSSVTIGLDSKGQVAGLFYSGADLNTNDLKKCIKAAQNRYTEVELLTRSS